MDTALVEWKRIRVLLAMFANTVGTLTDSVLGAPPPVNMMCK